MDAFFYDSVVIKKLVLFTSNKEAALPKFPIHVPIDSFKLVLIRFAKNFQKIHKKNYMISMYCHVASHPNIN